MESNPEQLLIARMLHVSPGELHYLESLPPSQLRPLRQTLESRMSRVGRDDIQRLGHVSSLIPATLSAAIASRVLGPMITALLASQLDHRKAVKVAQHLEPAFLAEVATYLPAEASTDLIDALPLETLERVTQILCERGESLIIATLLAALPARIADRLAALVDDEMLGEVLVLATDPGDLVREADPVLQERVRTLLPALPGPLAERVAAYC